MPACPSVGRTRRASARRRRFALFRATELPTFLEQVKPTRISAPSSRFLAWRTNPGVAILGARAAARNSERFFKPYSRKGKPADNAAGCERFCSGCPADIAQMTLSAERLAAACATCVQDLTTSFGRHPCAEAVAALAHQIGRLKRAFHLSRPISWAQAGRLGSMSSRSGKEMARWGGFEPPTP